MKIAILGGTGDMGFGLALRITLLGEDVIIGSRGLERAQEAAEKIHATTGRTNITGSDNRTAAEAADLVVIAVPSAGHAALLEDLKDVLAHKYVLDVTIPLAFKPLRYAPPSAGSNALETLSILGESATIACGFHTISATLLTAPETKLSGDVLIAGNNDELKEIVIDLASRMGFRAFNAGTLHLAASLEGLTPMLLGMNKRYGSKHIGIVLTGFPE